MNRVWLSVGVRITIGDPFKGDSSLCSVPTDERRDNNL